jgi:transposase-like protein
MKRHPRAFWLGLVGEVRGGATVADVARRHRVRETTLRWWRTQLREVAVAPGPRLLPVVADAPLAAVRHVEIAIGRAAMRVEEGTDVGYVAALARALSGVC